MKYPCRLNKENIELKIGANQTDGIKLKVKAEFFIDSKH
jgi:hypothetical protein